MSRELTSFAENLFQELTTQFPLSYEPKWRWKGLRVSAGMAYWRKGEIALSSVVLTTPEMVRDTLVHEYAHLLAVDRHGAKAANHGVFWQQAMRDLGAEPVTRHTYPVVRNTARQQVWYRCKKCGYRFSRNRQLPRNRSYVHRGCGGNITLDSVTG